MIFTRSLFSSNNMVIRWGVILMISVQWWQYYGDSMGCYSHDLCSAVTILWWGVVHIISVQYSGYLIADLVTSIRLLRNNNSSSVYHCYCKNVKYRTDAPTIISNNVLFDSDRFSWIFITMISNVCNRRYVVGTSAICVTWPVCCQNQPM